MNIPPKILGRASKVKLLVLDVDGVMTDGRIIYGDIGDELKCYDVKDGLGIVLLKHAGIPTAIITAKRSKVVTKRARDLGIRSVQQNMTNKSKALDKLIKKYKCDADEICFIGDDIIDLPVLKRVGLAVAVPNGVPEVIKAAHYMTHNPGGRGAVREIADLILKAQGKWDEVAGRYDK